MTANRTLIVASLLSIVLNTVHLAQDAVHATDGMPAAAVPAILLVMLVLLFGTLELSTRRAGYIIMLLGGLFAAWMPFLHGLGVPTTHWGAFFVWVLLALGTTGSFTAVLAARALARSFRPAGA